MSELLEFLRTHEEAFRSRARLASLYSAFGYQRHSNPDGYRANVAAWQRALAAATDAGLTPSPPGAPRDRFVLHAGDALAAALQTPDLGRPLALGAVVDEAVRARDLVPLREFLDASRSVYAKSAVPTLGQVVGWGLRWLGVEAGGAEDGRLARGDFVVMANAEAAAEAVLGEAERVATSNTSRVFSTELFASTFGPAVGALGPTDLSVLLTHLARDRSAIAYSAASGTVRFKSAVETQPSPITDEDVSIASLRSLISSLEPQIERLTDRVAELDKKAREAVASKQVAQAKIALRSKKLAETTLQQRSATLLQLEEVYAKIEQAADQVEIVRVMESSGQTLRNLNKQTGGVEKVQDVMDDLREQMMDVDEIGQTLNEVSAGAVDEGEVEDELEALERAERERVEAAEREEREKRAEAEAEKTRQKLAELDQIGEKKKTDEVETPPDEPLRAFTDNKDDAEKVAEKSA